MCNITYNITSFTRNVRYLQKQDNMRPVDSELLMTPKKAKVLVKTLGDTVKPVYKNHHFLLSGWQRFLNYGQLTKHFRQHVGRVRGD